jgi:hypothetical protein
MAEDQPRLYRWLPTPVSPFRPRGSVPESVPSSDRVLRHPEGRTAATHEREDDEWSDENLRRWEEADRLDPELAEWLKAQLAE